MDVVHAALARLERHQGDIALGAGLFFVSLVASLTVVAVVLVRMPEDYLLRPEATPFWPDRPAWARALGRLGKNLLGVVLVAIGVVLSLPGVPGQGALTILIGVMLLDIPGKRRLERRMLGGKKIHAAVNRLRARYGRPPLRLQESPGEPSPRGR